MIKVVKNKLIRQLKYLFKKTYFGFVQGHNYLNDNILQELNEFKITESIDILNKFEIKYASAVGNGKAVSFASGRMGFYSLMTILNIKKDDEVILQGHTCSVMANAILRAGGKPIYADIDPETFGSSANEIKKVISSKTKIIVAQHSFGIPCDIEPIIELARSHGIFLLEDCAITLGSKLNGIQVGNFGDGALFSTDHSKPVNTFIGGLIYTKNKNLYKKLKQIQYSSPNLSSYRKSQIFKKFSFERKYYNPTNYGKSFFINLLFKLFLMNKDSYLIDDYSKNLSSSYPYPAKLPTFLAHLGIIELKRWKVEKKKRRTLLKDFLELSSACGIENFLPKSYFNKNLEIIPLRFAYAHPNAKNIRINMSKFLDTNWFWFMKPLITCDSMEELGYTKGSCPISEKIGKSIINWPCVFNEPYNKQLLTFFKRIHT